MLKIRLRRMGSTNRPFYRVVVSDSRQATTASAPRVEVDRARVDYWVSKGAQLSDTVRQLVRRATPAG